MKNYSSDPNDLTNVLKNISTLSNLYSSKEKIDVGEIRETLKISNYFRNIVAHDEVMYSFSIHKVSSTTSLNKFFKKIYKGKSLHDLVMILKLVLPKKEHEELIEGIKYIFGEYESKFGTVEFKDIIQVAGFDDLWYEI